MSSAFPSLYENVTCPLDGYDAITVRVLVNPTGSVKNDWVFGHLGDLSCPECGMGTDAYASDPRAYCPTCTQARQRFGRAFSAAYGETRSAGLEFSTPEAALATLDSDALPDEFVSWLLHYCTALWQDRREQIKKKLPGFSATGN